jgi:hypothetical protein
MQSGTSYACNKKKDTRCKDLWDLRADKSSVKFCNRVSLSHKTYTHTYVPNCNTIPAQGSSADEHCTRLHTTHHFTTYNNLVRKTTARFSSMSCYTLSLPSPSADVVTGHHPITLPPHHTTSSYCSNFPPFPLPPLYPTWVIHNEQWYTNPSSEEWDGRKLHCRWGMVFRREWDTARTGPLGSRCSKARVRRPLSTASIIRYCSSLPYWLQHCLRSRWRDGGVPASRPERQKVRTPASTQVTQSTQEAALHLT